MTDVRFATVADAAVILKFVHGLAEYEKEPHAVKLDLPTLVAQLSDPRPPFECLIAERLGEPVGFALFFPTYSTWKGKAGIWLEDLFVAPHARRQGVGETLLARVASIARERGAGRLEWSVLDWNRPAVDFYASLGAELMSEWRICRLTDAALDELGGR
jgi:GNAT superfamily N-acetyltransferase